MGMRPARMVRAWETEQTQPKWKMHEQRKTWKISISGYGMKKRFLLVRNMAQTYESHRLQKYAWDYLSLVTLSLVLYLFMLFMLSLFVWCWCWCFWSLLVPPSVTIVPFCFSYIIWKTVQYFHSFFDAVPCYFFLFHLLFFFILFFSLLWSVIMGPSTWIVPIRCVLNIFD